MRPSGAGCGNVNFEEYTFILDIHCQQLGNMCQLNIYICIGYILPTIGGYMTVGGCLCALPGAGLGNMCQLNIYIVLDIVCQQLGDICQLEGEDCTVAEYAFF